MKELQELFARQLTRKEFIKLLGVALLSMVGVNNFIAMLNKSAKRNPEKAVAENVQAAKGFGASKFGV